MTMFIQNYTAFTGLKIDNKYMLRYICEVYRMMILQFYVVWILKSCDVIIVRFVMF